MSRVRIVGVAFVVLAMLLSAGSLLGITAIDDRPDKLVIWPSSEEAIAICASAIAEKFEEKYGIKVVSYPLMIDDQPAQLTLDGPVGKGPDLFTYSQEDLGTLVFQGIISPIEGEIAISQKLKDSFLPIAIEAITYDGKLYGLPMSYDTTALIYNKKLVPQPPKTFSELKQIAAKLTDVREKRYGFLICPESFFFTHGLIRGYGGYIFGRDKNGRYLTDDIGLNNKGAQAGVAFIKSFFDEGLIPLDANFTMMNNQFADGRTAMIIDGPWAFGGYAKAGIDFGVSILPKLPNGKYPITLSGVRAWGISRYSKNKKWALKLAEFMTSDEALTMSFKMAQQLPPKKALAGMVEKDPRAAAIQAQFRTSEFMPSCPEMSPVWAAMSEAVLVSIKGEKPIGEALDRAVQTIKENIAEMK